MGLSSEQKGEGLIYLLDIRKGNYSRTLLYRTHCPKGNRNWINIAGVRYIRTSIRASQVRAKWKFVRFSSDSLYPVFDISEFDCIFNVVLQVIKYGLKSVGKLKCMSNITPRTRFDWSTLSCSPSAFGVNHKVDVCFVMVCSPMHSSAHRIWRPFHPHDEAPIYSSNIHQSERFCCGEIIIDLVHRLKMCAYLLILFKDLITLWIVSTLKYVYPAQTEDSTDLWCYLWRYLLAWSTCQVYGSLLVVLYKYHK